MRLAARHPRRSAGLARQRVPRIPRGSGPAGGFALGPTVSETCVTARGPPLHGRGGEFGFSSSARRARTTTTRLVLALTVALAHARRAALAPCVPRPRFSASPRVSPARHPPVADRRDSPHLGETWLFNLGPPLHHEASLVISFLGPRMRPSRLSRPVLRRLRSSAQSPRRWATAAGRVGAGGAQDRPFPRDPRLWRAAGPRPLDEWASSTSTSRLRSRLRRGHLPAGSSA